MKGEQGMVHYAFEGHIILCEWNYRSKQIIQKLRGNSKTKNIPIVLIANIEDEPIVLIENKSIDDPNLFFVKGEVNNETLKRANVEKVKTVIILGDDKLDFVNRDTKVALSTLTVENRNRSAYTIVELVDEKYIEICKKAYADEIIVSSNLSGCFIVDETTNDGISKFILNLFSEEFDDNQLYKIPVPEDDINRKFLDVFKSMKEEKQSIIIAIQQGEEGNVNTNPRSDYELKRNDYLIMILDYNKYYFSNLEI
ncbi:MAG: NAD-binding protein [Rivularia sp. (in: cyanobacteria)]